MRVILQKAFVSLYMNILGGKRHSPLPPNSLLKNNILKLEVSYRCSDKRYRNMQKVKKVSAKHLIEQNLFKKITQKYLNPFFFWLIFTNQT